MTGYNLPGVYLVLSVHASNGTGLSLGAAVAASVIVDAGSTNCGDGCGRRRCCRVFSSDVSATLRELRFCNLAADDGRSSLRCQTVYPFISRSYCYARFCRPSVRLSVCESARVCLSMCIVALRADIAG